MDLDSILSLARRGRLYPAVILDGGDEALRQKATIGLARTLLCASADEAARPCGQCRACTRIAWPESEAAPFHPDFHVLLRDRRTATSAESTKRFAQAAYQAPFEASGQVFVVAEAATLTPEAADALLKILEEPPRRSPRHFLLLAATRRDLLPTLRSRALSIYLGPATALDEDAVRQLAAGFGAPIDRYLAEGSPVDLLLAAEALLASKGWEDPRARRPWALAAAAIVHDVGDRQRSPEARRALLELASDLLDAPRWRVRGITQGRQLEGMVARRLAR
jgi:hypothetical protein